MTEDTTLVHERVRLIRRPQGSVRISTGFYDDEEITLVYGAERLPAYEGVYGLKIIQVEESFPVRLEILDPPEKNGSSITIHQKGNVWCRFEGGWCSEWSPTHGEVKVLISTTDSAGNTRTKKLLVDLETDGPMPDSLWTQTIRNPVIPIQLRATLDEQGRPRLLYGAEVFQRSEKGYGLKVIQEASAYPVEVELVLDAVEGSERRLVEIHAAHDGEAWGRSADRCRFSWTMPTEGTIAAVVTTIDSDGEKHEDPMFIVIRA